MKIYVNSHDYQHVEYDAKYNKKYIYTNDGIYSYKKELQKMEIIEEIKEKDYKNFHFFVDTSKTNYTEIIYHIPYFHLLCEEEISKKNIGNEIFLVKTKYFDQEDHYFETDQISDSDSLYDAIITFLSSI
jgi:hypothetical protein